MQQNFNVGFFSDCQGEVFETMHDGDLHWALHLNTSLGDLDLMSRVIRGIYALEKQTCKLGLLGKLIRFECLLFDHEQDVFQH